jgi:hypothetical protein
MVEQQRQRIEQEMTKMVNELDLEYLRKMQVLFINKYSKKCFQIIYRQRCIGVLPGAATTVRSH